MVDREGVMGACQHPAHGWFTTRAEAAEAALRSFPQELLSPAAKILLGVSHLRCESTSCEVGASTVAAPVLRVLASDGTDADPFHGQMPLMFVITDQER